MSNSDSTRTERILELAAEWQTAEALSISQEAGAGSTEEAAAELEACRRLLNGVKDMREGRHETGIHAALPALAHLERRRYHHLLDWAYSAVGFSVGILGDPETGLEWVNSAIAGSENRTNGAQLRRSLSDKASLYTMLKENEKSTAVYEQALNISEPPPAVQEQAGLLNNLALTYLQLARDSIKAEEQRLAFAQKALDHAQAAFALVAEDPGSEQLMAWSLENMGNALSLLGRFDKAEAAFTRALPLAEPFERIHMELSTGYAWLLCEMKRFEEADEMLANIYEKAQTEPQEMPLDDFFEARIRLERLTGKTSNALLWSERRFRFMADQYRNRLTTVAHNAGIFVELEQARLAEREARRLFDGSQILEQQVQTQADAALRDDLTGCFSHYGLARSSEALFVPERRLAVVIADIDNFKAINNKYGHEAGNKVLQAMARIFNRSLRDADLVARPGGEEFLLIINDVGSEAAWGTCERLRLAVEKHGWDRIAPNLHVTASLGLSVRLNDEELEILTPKAEAAMHQAKAKGRNCVVAKE